MAYRKNGDKNRITMHKSQKDMIVEIVRLLDKHLEVCFPQMDRENFLETFKSIIIVNSLDSEDVQ